MTERTIDLSDLPPPARGTWRQDDPKTSYQPYAPTADLVPPFLPLGHDQHQVRINASTHDATGLIRKATPEAMGNTARLGAKIEKYLPEYTEYQLDRGADAGMLVVTYGISADAARDAVKILRSKGRDVSLLVMKTMLPVPPDVLDILRGYERVLVMEENLPGLLREILTGWLGNERVKGRGKIGHMVTPWEIVEEVERCRQES